jgi:dephospho-CoA kinase
VRDGLIKLFGSRVMTPAGNPDRQMMRQQVFTRPELKRALELLIHPRVRECCLDEKETARHEGSPLFVADVPLLFENGFDFSQQINILVAISRATQCSRLISRSPMEPAVADSIIDSQLPLSQKLKLADVVWWNEGPTHLLHSQVSRFFTYFLR